MRLAADDFHLLFPTYFSHVVRSLGLELPEPVVDRKRDASMRETDHGLCALWQHVEPRRLQARLQESSPSGDLQLGFEAPIYQKNWSHRGDFMEPPSEWRSV